MTPSNATLHTLETPRMRFTYRVQGDPDGLPMLLVHGSFASSRWWEPFLDVLPDAVRGIAPDLRGCGGSTHSQGGYEIPEQAQDLAAFVQALDLEDFDLVAHAAGGAIAVEYALAHPERIHTLVLVDPPPVEGVFTPLEALRLLERMRTDRELLAQALRALMPAAPPPSMEPDAFEAFFERLVEDAFHQAPAAFTAVAEALMHWNRFEEVRHLTLPTLLVWGEHDVVVERDAITRTLLAIPGANNLEVLRGVGHSPMIEAPVVLAERIIEFITEEYEDYAAVRAEAARSADEADPE